MGRSKLRNHVFFGKYRNLNFQNWSKALCLAVSEPTKRLAARVQHTLCVTVEVNKYLSRKMKKNMCKGNLNL